MTRFIFDRRWRCLFRLLIHFEFLPNLFTSHEHVQIFKSLSQLLEIRRILYAESFLHNLIECLEGFPAPGYFLLQGYVIRHG